MVAVEMDNHIDVVDIGIEDEDDDVFHKQKETKHVAIYESGKVLLKIERGTTVEVMKLLYEAECQQTSENVIGVRPRCSKELPCIVTLQETKLDEMAYDLIVKDKKTSSPVSSDDCTTPERSNGHCVTTRCIDCSRESWKSKRYTSVGMNTEISINPLMEIDSLRSMSNSYSPSNPPSTEPCHLPRSRGRPPAAQRPVPSSQHGTILYGSMKKDYLVAALPALPVGASMSHKEMEFLDRVHYRSRSPRTSPVSHIHGGGRTQISYPPMQTKGIDLDNIPYDNAHPMHRRPYHGSNHPVVMSSLSPPRWHRSRSPVIPHYNKNEPVEMYYPHKVEETRRSHCVRSPPHARSPPHTRSPGQFPRYEHRPSVATPPVQHADRPADVEPPVYVLPNDFDSQRDRVESHIVGYHPSKSYPTTERVGSNDRPVERPVDRPTASPNVSDSGKSSEEVPTGVPAERTLSCKICKQTFPTKSTLYKHLRGHTSDEKPFKCSECGQGFTLSSNLRQHRIIHRGYKPFQCEYCGKKFMRSNVYKQHRRIHTGEQMHKCDLCPSEFLQRYALIKHMKKTHNIDTLDS